MKKFIAWLTRPKYTIFLNGGCYVHTRKYPILNVCSYSNISPGYAPSSENFVQERSSVLMISRRKWWQRWA